MVPYGSSVSLFYAMWIRHGRGRIYESKERRKYHDEEPDGFLYSIMDEDRIIKSENTVVEAEKESAKSCKKAIQYIENKVHYLLYLQFYHQLMCVPDRSSLGMGRYTVADRHGIYRFRGLCLHPYGWRYHCFHRCGNVGTAYWKI